MPVWCLILNLLEPQLIDLKLALVGSISGLSFLRTIT